MFSEEMGKCIPVEKCIFATYLPHQDFVACHICGRSGLDGEMLVDFVGGAFVTILQRVGVNFESGRGSCMAHAVSNGCDGITGVQQERGAQMAEIVKTAETTESL